MGTKRHTPRSERAADDRHAHDDTQGLGAGIRPGTRSRILEARKRKAEREA